MDDSTLTISLIIPVHRNHEPFQACMASVRNLKPAPDEIIVVADGDPEGAALAGSMGIQVVETTVAGGPGAARNRGAEQARGDILFFLDADVMVYPDATDRLHKLFAEEPEIAAVIGSYDDQPSEPNFLSQYRNLLHHYVHQNASPEGSTFWGACGAIRRVVFQDMGGFDERYRYPSVEDIELGCRMRQRGYRIRLDKALHIKHLKRWTARSILYTDFFRRALPWTAIILRDRRLVNDLNMKTSDRLSVAASGLLFAATAGSSIRIEMLMVTGLMAGMLFMLNQPIYGFFYRKRGLWFAVKSVPWHWLYFLYSGLAFLIGIVRHGLGLKSVERG
ncbi:MAG TPA: glycosyltransferase [candidate division Zixibacteria bacterium]|nr:glycosyltransferase [candidate division Zixibacteria bacterium]